MIEKQKTGVRYALFYSVCILVLLPFLLFGFVLSPFFSGRNRHQLVICFNKIVLAMAALFFNLRIQVEDVANIPQQHCVVVSNHQSSLETVLLQTLFNPLSTVLKIELLKMPVVGRALRFMEPIAIDRSEPVLSYKSLIREGENRLGEQRSVLIFPEGTRVAIGAPIRFNKGAASLAVRCQVPILPVAHNSGLHWPQLNPDRQRRIITFKIGKPIYPQGKTVSQVHRESECWVADNVKMLPSVVEGHASGR
ncbi:MAG: 1-acyl-sn-glycerol-3-phosphate acyltransferase [Pseudomonadales bacterium]|nr:1-acyl-sn-glycerol-3-phosphate acyltransferase [Pseudomonadales bacterium]